MSFIERLKSLFGFTPSPPEATLSGPKQVPVSGSMPAGPPPASQRRDRLLGFLLDALRTYQNEPGNAPRQLTLCILCPTPEEEELYGVALWANQPGKFRQEANRQLADHYIQLPEDWKLDWKFYSDTLPDCTFRQGPLGLIVPNARTMVRKARITTLSGQTEQEHYLLDPAQKTTFCIGRGRMAQTPSGRVRTNDIVILNEDDAGYDSEKGAGNGAVSRAHATICYDTAKQRYHLLVDPGGLPASGNKTKLIHTDEHVERADIPGMMYPLSDGDQLELGGEVVLLFELA